MLLNEDMTRRVAVHAAGLPWVASPTAGVERRMLFRIGEEKARATSIVRYAPGSRFPRHRHPGGEEFLVLEGVFQDETGEYPAGSYVRNPPGSAHAPGSEPGCVIFVKLWQFRREDLQPLALRPGEGARAAAAPGQLESLVLFDDMFERVRIDEWAPGSSFELPNPRGLELLVLSGGFSDGEERLERWSWLRLPEGLALRGRAGEHGVRVWSKSAALRHATECAL
ncbi:MAG: cupin domain-containing protein [Steroidobacteraceae bacterium]